MTTNSNNEYAARVLQTSARALAGYAAGELLQSVPTSGEAFGTDPFSLWQNWLTARTEELAAAIAIGRPELFVSQVQWGRTVLESRGVAPPHFRAGIECLQQVLAKELPETVRELANGYVHLALMEFDGDALDACSRLKPETEAGRLASRYVLAVLEGDRRRAQEIVLNDGAGKLSIPQIYLEVILPAQEEIGRMWVANEITVAEEHFATATARVVLAQLLAKAPLRASNGKTVVTAAVAGNRHDIGLQIVSDFFEMDGWRAIQLGADVPVGDLAEAVDCFQVDLLALSATQTVHIQTLRETIQAVRRRRDSDAMKILVGGQALRFCSDTIGQIGADAYAADAIEAMKLADSLLGLPHDPDFFAGN